MIENVVVGSQIYWLFIVVYYSNGIIILLLPAAADLLCTRLNSD